MPIYEYICEECNEELEIIQKIADEPLALCPSCNQNSLKKKTSMSAFHLKGGGWYKDGYGDAKGEKSSKKADSGSKTTEKTSAKDSSTDKKATSSTDKKATGSVPKSKAS